MIKLFNVDGLPELLNIAHYEFHIKDVNDIFNAAGQILKLSQDFEMAYKDYAILRELKVNNLQNSSLNKINNELNKENKGKIITDEEHDNLEKIIMVKNYFMHEFFVNDFEPNDYPNGYDGWLADINKELNLCYNYICEAVDYVNKMAILFKAEKENADKRYIITPKTIWDNKGE